MVTGAKQAGDGGVHSGHAGCGRDPVFRAFQQAHLLHKLVRVRIGKPGVDVARNLIGEQGARLFGVVEYETRCEK